MACIWITGFIQAQDFTIRKVEINPEHIVLHYDLLDTTRNRTYTVFVYSSRDNFLAPLTKVTGDAGIEVKPGANRKIYWNAREELGHHFDGDVELEIRGRLYIPFIRFEGFQEVDVRKRTVPFLVKWSGGTRQNILDFQLWRGDKLVYTFPNIPNAFEYKLSIPGSVKPGKGYYLKISDTKNKEQVVYTSKFDLKRRVPLLLKVLPLMGVGYLSYHLLSVDTGNKWLDEPPGTP